MLTNISSKSIVQRITPNIPVLGQFMLPFSYLFLFSGYWKKIDFFTFMKTI